MYEFNYRTVKNFGGEKTLANLVNRHNSPSFLCQFLPCSVSHSLVQPTFYAPLDNKRGVSPVCMKAAAALQSFNNCMDSPFILVITTDHSFHSEPRTTTHR